MTNWVSEVTTTTMINIANDFTGFAKRYSDILNALGDKKYTLDIVNFDT